MLAFIGLSFFLLSFSFGMSSTPWTLNSEIYPLHVIGSANSLSATTNWVFNAIVAFAFKEITEISIASESSMYFALGGMAIACFIFTYFLIPETAHKPINKILEEILGKDYSLKERSFSKDDS